MRLPSPACPGKHPPGGQKRGFAALRQPLTFLSRPLEKDTEITGPLAARLFAASSMEDMDLFLTFQSYLDGAEIDFQGAVYARTLLSHGWLRASHRKLDPYKSEPHQPYQSHGELQPLVPGGEVRAWR